MRAYGPTYFPPHRIKNRAFVDGGIWANTPSLVAVDRAHQRLGIPLSEMRVVRLGNDAYSNGEDVNKYSDMYLPALARRVTDMMFATQAKLADGVTETLLGTDNVLPVGPTVNERFELDDVSQKTFDRLLSNGSEVAEQKGLQFKNFVGREIQPREAVIADVKRALRRYGFMEDIENPLLNTAEYVTLSVLESRLKREENKPETCLRFVNDEPIQSLRDDVYGSQAREVCQLPECPVARGDRDNSGRPIRNFGVNSYPSRDRSRFPDEDLIARLKFANENMGDYFLMPPEEIHLSIVILDDRVAIVYPKPMNRSVCNVSEALWYADLDAVQLWIGIFGKIFNYARAYANVKGVNPVEKLLELANARKAEKSSRGG